METSEDQTPNNQYSDRHFAEFLKLIHDVADSRTQISSRNQFFMVEVIRSIAEYVVYGEKLGRSFMDTLIEKNTLQAFSMVLRLNNRAVNLQLIQTTSILLANIKDTQARYYILSHGFLNELISFKYNYYDEEFVDQLISFLKSLALQLDETTVKFFLNTKYSNFPLLQVTQRFYNHGDQMVRNAAHIIILTIFKLNDEAINETLLDMPFCIIFAHFGCYLRDTILELDSTHNTAAIHSHQQTATINQPQKSSQQPSTGQKTAQQQQQQVLNPNQLAPKQLTLNKGQTAFKQIDYTKMADAQEDMQDFLEFLSEIYQNCAHNQTVIRLLTNALLNYCIMPVVVPALVGVTTSQNTIGISTAIYVTTSILRNLKSQIVHNIFAQILLGQQIPVQINKVLKQQQLGDPTVTYRWKWGTRLPTRYDKVKWLQEYTSPMAFKGFCNEYSRFLPFVTEFAKTFSSQKDDEYDVDLLKYLETSLTSEELSQIEMYHFQISKALGHPVGLCKLRNERVQGKFTFESLTCRFQQFHISLLDPESDESKSVETQENEFKKQFIMFLCAKDDNLLLQTSSLFLTLVSQSKVSQSILYHGQFFPSGGQTLKTLLFQKLMGNATDNGDMDDSTDPYQTKQILSVHPQTLLLEKLETEFVQSLYQKLQAQSEPMYDPFVVQALIKALSPEKLQYEMPLFRTLTIRLLTTLLHNLAFNKANAGKCLLEQDAQMIETAFQQATANLMYIISNQPQDLDMQCVSKFEHLIQTFKPIVSFDQIEQLILNPKIQVTSCDSLPSELQQDTDFNAGHMQIFLVLRYLKTQLISFDRNDETKFKKGWKSVREQDSWKEGQKVHMKEQDCELILCNTRVQQKMQKRQVLVDQDYFFLMELPKLENQNQNSQDQAYSQPNQQAEEVTDELLMIVQQKNDLKTLQTSIDQQEPRNLIISDQLLLMFDSANKCNYVKKMLEENKQTQTRRQVQECKVYLDSLNPLTKEKTNDQLQ